MAKKLMSLVALVTLTFALASTPAALGAGQAAAPGGQARMGKAGRERHPEIREAMRALRHAKEVLTREAAHDFGGHKVEAVKNIDQALEHLQQALQSDQK